MIFIYWFIFSGKENIEMCRNEAGSDSFSSIGFVTYPIGIRFLLRGIMTNTCIEQSCSDWMRIVILSLLTFCIS